MHWRTVLLENESEFTSLVTSLKFAFFKKTRYLSACRFLMSFESIIYSAFSGTFLNAKNCEVGTMQCLQYKVQTVSYLEATDTTTYVYDVLVNL